MNMVRKFTGRHVAKALILMALPFLVYTFSSCDDKESTKYLPSNLKVCQTVLPDTIKAMSTADISIIGQGFAAGDVITLTNADSKTYSGSTTDVTTDEIKFTLPSNFPQTGKYTVRVVRGDEDVVLGNTYIQLVYDFNIGQLEIPAKPTVVSYESRFAIAGTGFQNGDVITLAPVTVKSNKETVGTPVALKTLEVTPTGIESEIPISLYATKATKYYVAMKRNNASADLGATTITYKMEPAPKEGFNVCGVVHCNFAPIADVVVSDGVDVTRTDADGCYYLNSDKSKGYVFISTPSGYAAPTEKDKNVPMNFAYLTEGTNKSETHSFALTEERQGSYVLLNMADMHLANRNQDIDQYEKGFIKDVNDLIKQYEDEGMKVYGITLGDQSWDAYWYDNKFALPEAMKEVYKIKCPVYNCMGNHDNDPYVGNNNNLASMPWVKNVCPNYYSFNIGQAHYVILDNINYINNGGATGVIGDRSYNSLLDPVQLEWFKKDLATVADKSKPLVICMHIALNTYIYWSNNQWNQGLSMTSGTDLLQAVKEFTNVKVLTGHTHINFDGHNNDGTVEEHNIGAVCATWWWTGKNGYAGNHLCRDGSPGGYAVWEVAGPKMEMYYKSIGYDRSYQFRTTDINQVQVTPERFAPNCTDATLLSKFNNYTYGYEKLSNDNEVQICVFNYGQGWDITVTENGTPLTVNHVAKRDPLHVVSYGLQRLNVNKEPTDGFCSLVSSRIFHVNASSPTSTLEIKVTDNYGNVYTETMTRPKAFHYLMK